MFDTMEFPPSERSSFHWHAKCDYEGMHSCSPVYVLPSRAQPLGAG